MSSKKIINCPTCDKKFKVPKGKSVRFSCPQCQTYLEFDDRSTAHQISASAGETILNVLSYLIALPFFLILHKTIPDFEWPFHADRILLFLVSIVIVRLVFISLKEIILIGFVGAILYLLYGTLWGNYGFSNVYSDYKHLVYTFASDPRPVDVFISDLKAFPHRKKIVEATDYNNPEVRNFAVEAANKHFKDVPKKPEYRTLMHCFSVFKEINSRWNYVNDPKGTDYFAKASESLKHFSGDCDDHSILMVSAIRAVGGTPRLVSTTNHIYPEILIGNKSDMEAANYLIKAKLFEKETKGKNLNYHVDAKGNIWLNLDYTEKYPGGEYMYSEILGTMTIN